MGTAATVHVTVEGNLRLFIVPVKTFLLFKTQDVISCMGGGGL
jgi:hypothetical protein